MPVNVTETNFELIIQHTLVEQNGYVKRTPHDYDRELCMDSELVVKFIQATQPYVWARYKAQYPTEAAQRLTHRLARQIERKGAAYVLGNEFKDSGCHFNLVYFRPNTTLNPAEQKCYKGNIFSVVRQLRYRPEDDPSQPELDLILFLNGLPIFTAELKNQLTGQNVEDAKDQYMSDRSSQEPLFKLGRCLAHFAVDDREVYVTTHLQDDQTEFLPFNQGYNHGAGNPSPPPTSGRFATSYLWEDMWARDSVLNLVQRFIHMVDELDDDGEKTGRKKLIFPRYHQLSAVRELVAHAREHGPGHRYLVQHSAGSGKTMTISWLAHQLSVLHDDQDQPVQALHRTLSAGSLEEAEAAESGEMEDMEDILVKEMALRRQLSNASTFAFTATPKAKTLQLFGTPGPGGKPRPFHLYPMRQAIEEGFILDVLQNYTTYRSYWSLLKAIEDDPQYDRSKAQHLLKNLVALSEHAIDQKVTIIVDHFARHVAHRIDGHAKAMIVTRSRLHAVRYKLAVDRYLQEQGYPFRSLVAFSGTVKDGNQEFTETGMNTASAGVRIPQSATAETFKKPRYRLLIVANKFQTGFDQPLLHTMYVDKKLGGVNAVQTLSRLNRTHPPHKKETMVLDFVNEADQIQKAFEPYYEATLLTEPTDPNVLYQLQAELDDYHFYAEDDIDALVELYFKGRREDLASLYALLDPVVDRVAAAPRDEQESFRRRLNDFVRLYAFLSQILPFAETDWERRFHYCRLLLRRILQRLFAGRDDLPQELRDQVTLEFYRTQQTFQGRLHLGESRGELLPVGIGAQGGYHTVEQKDPLSTILEELNQIFGERVNSDTPGAIQHLQSKLDADIALQQGTEANPPKTFRLLFDQVVEELFAEMVDNYFEFYRRVTDDHKAKERLFDWLFEEYQRRKGEE